MSEALTDAAARGVGGDAREAVFVKGAGKGSIWAAAGDEAGWHSGLPESSVL